MVTQSALPPPAAAAHSHSFAADLQAVLGIARRGWPYILISIVVCLTLAGLYLAKSKRIYQASVRLLIVHNAGRSLSVVNNDPMRGMEGTEDPVPTHMTLIKSPLIGRGAIEVLNLWSRELRELEVKKEREANRPIEEKAKEGLAARSEKTGADPVKDKGKETPEVGGKSSGDRADTGGEDAASRAMRSLSQNVVEEATPSSLLIDPDMDRSLIDKLLLDQGLLGRIIGSTRVSRPDRMTKIIVVDYLADSPDEACLILEAITESYKRFLEKTYQKSSKEIITLLSRARDDLTKEMKQLSSEYLAFRKEHPILTIDEKGQTFASRRLDQWDQAKNATSLAAIRLKSQLQMAEQLSNSGADSRALSEAMGLLGTNAAGTLSSQGATSPMAGSAADLRRELASAEIQRKTAQRVVDHMKSIWEIPDAAVSATDDMIWGAFTSDPASMDVIRLKTQAEKKIATVSRLTRNPQDPSRVQAEAQLAKANSEVQHLWNLRYPILKRQLEREMQSDKGQALQKAEIEFAGLEAKVKSLRETLAEVESANIERLRLREEELARKDGKGAESPELKHVREQIARAESGPNDSRGGESEVKGAIGSIQQSLRALETMRKEYEEQYEKDLSVAKETDTDRLEETTLRGRMAQLESLYNTVVEQLKQANFVSDYSSISSQMIDPPMASSSPVSPRIKSTLEIAGLLGVIFGVVLAMIVDRLDQSIRSVSEVRKILDFSVLGVILDVPKESNGAGGEAVGLISFATPHSQWAESYRSTRTNLEFIRRNANVKSILVTSPNSGDGKTTTTSNLAISLAQAGRRVLLVDADLRKPSQHELHGLRMDKGLVHVLKGLLPLTTVIQATAVENLDFLATGPVVDNPSELLSSPNLVAFLEEAGRLYDVVMIDSSPLLAVTDPSIIGSLVDGIVVVLNPKAIIRHQLIALAERLRLLGTPVLGLLVNGLKRDEWRTGDMAGYGGAYGYGYGNGYGYGYGYGRGAERKQLNGEPAVAGDPQSGPPLNGKSDRH